MFYSSTVLFSHYWSLLFTCIKGHQYYAGTTGHQCFTGHQENNTPVFTGHQYHTGTSVLQVFQVTSIMQALQVISVLQVFQVTSIFKNYILSF